jgi:hypothetical protein
MLHQARLDSSIAHFCSLAIAADPNPKPDPLPIEAAADAEVDDADEEDTLQLLMTSLPAPGARGRLPASSSTAIACAPAVSASSIATIGVMWKFDGTPVPAYVKARIVTRQMGLMANGEFQDQGDELSLSGLGAECFTQKGVVVKCPANAAIADATRMAVAVPPKALGSKGTAALLAALEFDGVVDVVIRELQREACDANLVDVVANRFPIIVVVLTLVMDAASSNLCAVRQVMEKYRRFNVENKFNIRVVVTVQWAREMIPHTS